MIYLDPKSDLAFKRLFGDLTHKNILISFLNSILERSEGYQITNVAINDPHNVAETPQAKTSIVDVRCTDQRNHQFIVEMQVMTQKDYAARAQYYSSLALSRQLASGETYDKLVPVIFVGILDFNLFKGDHCVSHHLIMDNRTSARELTHLEFHFVELQKFNKELDELETIADKWIYFLRYAGTLQEVPASLKDPVLKEAFDVLAQSNWSKNELEAYDKYLDAIRSAASQLETAEEIGMAKGMAKGIAKGKIEGGKEKAIEIAKQFLDICDVATIAKKTGLSIKEVEALKK
jgi:conserved hypothetical protein (putative transposase or invertase)